MSREIIGVVSAIVFFIVGLFIVATTLSTCGRNEDGWHRGRVTDVSRAGIFCKTYEGQIMSGSGNASVVYNFTITTKETYDRLREFQQNGKEVDLHYYSQLFNVPCSTSHANFVDDVRGVK